MTAPVTCRRRTPKGRCGDGMTLSDRNAGVVAEILAGRQGAEVARDYGISRERVRQIFTRATACGIPSIGRRCPLCESRYFTDKPTHHLTGEHLGVVNARRDSRHAAALARFWSLVDKNGPVPEFAPHLGPCWIWTGRHFGVKPGVSYGQATLKLERFAHRATYLFLVGPIPVGLELDHLCRVTLCCNPAHLEPVTHRENCGRGKLVALRHLHAPRAAHSRTHCVHGHERTAANTYPSGNCRPCQRAVHNRRQVRRLAERVAS